jgi:hypothetical protein
MACAASGVLNDRFVCLVQTKRQIMSEALIAKSCSYDVSQFGFLFSLADPIFSVDPKSLDCWYHASADARVSDPDVTVCGAGSECRRDAVPAPINPFPGFTSSASSGLRLCAQIPPATFQTRNRRGCYLVATRCRSTGSLGHHRRNLRDPRGLLARPKRFELLTPRFVVWCSLV